MISGWLLVLDKSLFSFIPSKLDGTVFDFILFLVNFYCINYILIPLVFISDDRKMRASELLWLWVVACDTINYRDAGEYDDIGELCLGLFLFQWGELRELGPSATLFWVEVFLISVLSGSSVLSLSFSD